jgi:hypothetical protein
LASLCLQRKLNRLFQGLQSTLDITQRTTLLGQALLQRLAGRTASDTIDDNFVLHRQGLCPLFHLRRVLPCRAPKGLRALSKSSFLLTSRMVMVLPGMTNRIPAARPPLVPWSSQPISITYRQAQLPRLRVNESPNQLGRAEPVDIRPGPGNPDSSSKIGGIETVQLLSIKLCAGHSSDSKRFLLAMRACRTRTISMPWGCSR